MICFDLLNPEIRFTAGVVESVSVHWKRPLASNNWKKPCSIVMFEKKKTCLFLSLKLIKITYGVAFCTSTDFVYISTRPFSNNVFDKVMMKDVEKLQLYRLFSSLSLMTVAEITTFIVLPKHLHILFLCISVVPCHTMMHSQPERHWT